jgi:hypothetical protein
MSFLGSFAKICMIFGILMNKILKQVIQKI